MKTAARRLAMTAVFASMSLLTASARCDANPSMLDPAPLFGPGGALSPGYQDAHARSTARPLAAETLEENERYRVPGRAFLGVGGAGLFVYGLAISALGGVHVTRRIAIEVDGYVGAGSVTGDTMYGVRSVGLSARVFLLDTLNVRGGISRRSVSQEIYGANGSDTTWDIDAELAVGSRWDSAKAFVAFDWITLGRPVLLSEVKPHDPRLVDVVGPRVTVGGAW